MGRDQGNQQTDLAWDFLRPHLAESDAFIFSRPAYPPAWVDQERLWVIQPSINPFSAKNEDLDPDDVLGILTGIGLIGSEPVEGPIAHRDGHELALGEREGLLPSDVAPELTDRLVVQVSRWDRLKDMAGVLSGFADRIVDFADDVHLMLVGPDVSGVSDDPEGPRYWTSVVRCGRPIPMTYGGASIWFVCRWIRSPRMR